MSRPAKQAVRIGLARLVTAKQDSVWLVCFLSHWYPLLLELDGGLDRADLNVNT